MPPAPAAPVSGTSVGEGPPRGALRGILASRYQLQLVLLLTLLLLLLYSHDFWYINIPLSVMAIAGFIVPGLRTSTAFWAVVVAILALGSFGNWYVIDNHKYLLLYWCLAVLAAMPAADPARVLATSARWMIGLVFLLAVLQKSLAGDYLDGSFFHYELLLDERFSGLARYVGGLPEHMNDMNQAARRALISFDSDLPAVQLQSTEQTAALGRFITWWDYLLQALLAVAFLAPGRGRVARSRDLWLLLFLFSTYLFAPVIGFGWVLAIMGLAQTAPEHDRRRALYVLAFLFLQVYRIPWSKLFTALAATAG